MASSSLADVWRVTVVLVLRRVLERCGRLDSAGLVGVDMMAAGVAVGEFFNSATRDRRLSSEKSIRGRVRNQRSEWKWKWPGRARKLRRLGR
jgi:hypothetical protein